MSAILKVSATVPRAVPIRWRQPGGALPLDCTGMTMAVHATTLPFVPLLEPVDQPQGAFRIAPFTPMQRSQLEVGKSYGLHALLRSALGEPVDELRLTIEAI